MRTTSRANQVVILLCHCAWSNLVLQLDSGGSDSRYGWVRRGSAGREQRGAARGNKLNKKMQTSLKLLVRPHEFSSVQHLPNSNFLGFCICKSSPIFVFCQLTTFVCFEWTFSSCPSPSLRSADEGFRFAVTKLACKLLQMLSVFLTELLSVHSVG